MTYRFNCGLCQEPNQHNSMAIEDDSDVGDYVD